MDGAPLQLKIICCGWKNWSKDPLAQIVPCHAFFEVLPGYVNKDILVYVITPVVIPRVGLILFLHYTWLETLFHSSITCHMYLLNQRVEENCLQYIQYKLLLFVYRNLHKNI